MSKQKFIDEWKHKLTGIAVFGAVSEMNDGPLVRAGKIFELPKEVEKLLGAMYDSISRDIDQQADLLILTHATATPDAKKRVVDRLRDAFGKSTNGHANGVANGVAK